MDPLPSHFQVLVVGTGLTESLLAAFVHRYNAHARRGDSVLHIDPNQHYGGAWSALNWLQLTSLSDGLDGFSNFEHRVGPAAVDFDLTSDCHQFMVELAPKLLYAQGTLVQLFRSTGVGRHLDFKLFDGTYMASLPSNTDRSDTSPFIEQDDHPSLFSTVRVPASREDVFTSDTVSLIDKRRLMKFLTHVVDINLEVPLDLTFQQFMRQHNLNSKLESVLRYGIALLSDVDENVPATTGVACIKKYLDSVGQFGNSPFLMCMYGGGGEISQSMCRISAIYGGVYILGRPVSNLGWDHEKSQWTVTVDGNGEELHFTADQLIGNPYTLQRILGNVTVVAPPSPVIQSHHAIMITKHGIRHDSNLGLFLVPPEVLYGDQAVPRHSVQILDMSNELHVCPNRMHVLHFRAPSREAIDTCMSRIIPASAVVHTVLYTHNADPAIVIPDDLGPVYVAPSVSMTLDLDGDIQPVLTQWTRNLGQTEFFEALPNPEEQYFD